MRKKGNQGILGAPAGYPKRVRDPSGTGRIPLFFLVHEIKVTMWTDFITGVNVPVALGTNLSVPLLLRGLRSLSAAEKKITGFFGFRRESGRLAEFIADSENPQHGTVGTFSVLRNRNRQFNAADGAGDDLPRLPRLRR